jgi:hypothetical protein
MDDTKKIKTMFLVDVISIISDTTDESQGEASTGYEYRFDASLPELAYALGGFLKQLDADEDIRATMAGNEAPGDAFITLLKSYYDMQDE